MICREYQHAVSYVRENGWRNDQRSSQFARHWVNRAILRVYNVAEFLLVHLQNYLYRKLRGIFGEADKFLIIYSKGAQRSMFAKPVRLRIRSIFRDPTRQIFRNEFVGWKRRIDFHRVAGVGKSYFLQDHRNIAAVNCLHFYCCRLPWRDSLIGCRRFHMQAKTCGDDRIQLRLFLPDPRVVLNSTHRLPQLQQLRHGSGWIAWAEVRNDLTNLCSNRFRIRNARPSRIDPLEKGACHRLTFQQFEIFFSRSASWRTAYALALMHAQTGCRNLSVSFAEKRIVTARFQNDQTRRIKRKVAVRKEKWRRVPNQSRRAPGFHESQLLRKTIWVT